jgi:serine protease inhibitor
VTDSAPHAALAAARADDAFGVDLYRVLGARGGNMVFSPASIAAALRMALLGARGETAAQLATALHLASPQDSADGLRLLSAGLSRLSGGVTFRAPNTMWVQSGLPLLPEFTTVLTGLAAVTVRDADFAHAAEQARLQINATIAEQTAGKIADLLPPRAVGPLTRLVLANAVYLKAAWAQPFQVAETTDAPFYLSGDGTDGASAGGASTSGASTGSASTDSANASGGSAISVPMMHRTGRLGYLRGSGYQAVILPYAGGLLAMAVILPDGLLGPLEEMLAAHGTAGLLTGVTPQEVRLALPRFRATASFSLEPFLKSLGVAAAFDRYQADFSGITKAAELFIGAAVHKAYIDVDEHGTEAAAATGVAISARMAIIQEPQPVVVTVDRPFMFAITDVATGRPLFLGRVADPAAG